MTGVEPAVWRGTEGSEGRRKGWWDRREERGGGRMEGREGKGRMEISERNRSME